MMDLIMIGTLAISFGVLKLFLEFCDKQLKK